MKFKKHFLLYFFSLIFIISCTDSDPLSPIDNSSNTASIEKINCNPGKVTVMTRNIYIGADVDKLLLAEDPSQIPEIVAELFHDMQATNFPKRAVALANEIKSMQPDLIGLQEVSLIRTQSPGDLIFGGSIPAETVLIDYLEVLLKTMSSMGLHYEAVAKNKNTDIELPMAISQTAFDDIRLTDYDVILAKKGIKVSNVVERNFKARLTIPEMGIEVPRGFSAVTAEVNGNKYRFVNTHLEDADQGGPLVQIQLAQATELLLRLATVKIPVILVGDFNSAAPTEPTYRLVTLTKRYKDTWLLNTLSDNPEGFTYGHDADLLNLEPNFWKRIDYIFVRNEISLFGPRLRQVTAEVLGDETTDKIEPSGLWPSDHGGVAAELNFTYSNYWVRR